MGYRAKHTICRRSCPLRIQISNSLLGGKRESDVDCACVEMLKTPLVTAFENMLKAFQFGFTPRCSQGFEDHVRRRIMPLVSDFIFTYMRERWNPVLQAHLYPSFERFHSHANQTKGGTNSTVTVSCKGLRGSRDEVYETTLHLLRLVLVFYLQDTQHFLFRTITGIAANHFLPCVLNNLIWMIHTLFQTMIVHLAQETRGVYV